MPELPAILRGKFHLTVLIMANILLLNDQEKIREQIRQWLLNAGHNVEILDQPFSLAERIGKSNPDLIILDTDLGCVDGLYIIEKLESINEKKKVPILVTASSNDLLILLDSIEKGASDYLSLPSSEDKLGRKVNSIIAKK